MRNSHFWLFYVDNNNHFVQDEGAFLYLDYSLDPKCGSIKEFCNSSQYLLSFYSCNSSSSRKFHIRINFKMKYKSDVIPISTFYSPLFSQGENTIEELSEIPIGVS